ncbi:hypothetical protein LCGC14_1227230 [marine sediment metagenome]|uniref:DUF2997 domain-containing protein n=1 Tax=marine sediment metagenome TaxID=412755 RepID=A0A0F9LDK7_9ZZZZ
MKEIEITIDKDGQVEIDLKGFQGKGCEEITRQLAKGLGSIVRSDKKPEFYKQIPKQKQRIKRGL